ncbi:MAG: hypothetical protein U1F57_03555 [bacterium]
MRRLFFTFLFFLSVAARAQTSPADLARYAEAFGEEKPFAQSFIEKAQRKGSDPRFMMEVLGQAKSMRDQGLPAEPYLLKANEGLAKGVAAPQMLPALRNTQKQTETAGDLVHRALERGAVSPSPQSQRQAVLNYQRALLNQVPSSALQKLSESVDPASKRKIRIDELGGAAHEFSKMNQPGVSWEEALGKVKQSWKSESPRPEGGEEIKKGKTGNPPEEIFWSKEKVKPRKAEKEIKHKEDKWEKNEEKGWKKFEKENRKEEKEWKKKDFDHGGGPPPFSHGNGKGHGKGD